MSLFLGRGDGAFQSSSVIPSSNEPAALVLADVNADGILDLLAVNKSGNTISVMLGAGDGSFLPGADYVVGNSPLSVALADFNKDGHLDFATANSGDGTVSLARGNGDGTFQAALDYRTHLEHKSIAVGDLDGDGHPDVVVASFCGNDPKCAANGTASVFLSDGKGGLRAYSSYTLGKGPTSIGLADVNGDKKLDLIAVNRDDGTVMVLLGNGDGTFQEGVTYSAGSSPVSLSIGDFNQDGKPDLAIAALCGSAGCQQLGSVNILLGNGDGSFKPGASYEVGFSPAAVSVGDLNGDGKLDLVVANSCGESATCSTGTASVLLGDGKGSFTLKSKLELGKQVSSIALADLNQDGKLDLIVANGGDNQVEAFLGNGNGTFSNETLYAVGIAPSSLVVADFEGDGHPDVAVANLKNSTVSLLHGNGDGTLQTGVAYGVGLGPEALAALDLDGSGRLALVTANGNTGGSPAGNDITVLAVAGGDRPVVSPISPNPTSVSPSSGPIAGGTSVAIAGTNFVKGATATFGSTAATNVVVVSATEITATTPAHAAGAVDVVVTNPNKKSGTLTNGYTYDGPPDPTSVSPSSGATSGETPVTIGGTGFLVGATVTFGSTAATNVVVVSPTEITATTPAHAAGAVNVVVTNPDNQSGTLTNGYTYATAPAIAKAFKAATIPVGGSTLLTLTITNSNAGAILIGVGFTDNLPAGLLVASTPNLNNTCSGTATAKPGTQLVSLSGGTLGAGGSCTVSVNVTGTTVGNWTNITGNVSSTNGGAGNTASAAITVNCAFSINPTSNNNILADDGTAGTVFSIAVSADPSCTWSALATSSGGPNLPWLNIQKGAGPITGNGNTTYTVTNNIGALATASRNGNVAYSYAGGPTNYPATQAVVSVGSVSPLSPSVHVSGSSNPTTVQFSATVTGAHNTAVTWSISGTTCPGGPCGSINSTTGVYTPPPFLTVTQGTDTILATSVVDNTKVTSQTGSVTVIDSPPVCTLSVNPASPQSYSLPFTAKVNCSEAQTDMASVATNWADCSNNASACTNSASFSPTTNVYTSSPTHIYIVPSAGANNPTTSYSVMTTGTSSGGLTGSTPPASAIAVNNPPVCQTPIIEQVTVNNTTTNVTVVATCTDVEPDIATLSIDSGDGTAGTNCPFTNQSTASCTQTHSYAAAASGQSFTITLSAVDNFPNLDGISNSATVTIWELPTDPAAPTAPGGPSSGSVNATPTVALTANSTLTPECTAISNGDTTPQAFTGNALGINCNFSPSGQQIASGGTFTLTLSVDGPAPSGGGDARTPKRLASLGSLWLGLPAIVFVGVGANLFRSRRKFRLAAVAFGLFLAVLLVGLLGACGGGFTVPPTPVLPPQNNPTPPGTYYITVVGLDSNSNIVQTWIVPLNVLPPS